MDRHHADSSCQRTSPTLPGRDITHEIDAVLHAMIIFLLMLMAPILVGAAIEAFIY